MSDDPVNIAAKAQELANLVLEAQGWAKATAYHKYGIAWHNLEQASKAELIDEALGALMP